MYKVLSLTLSVICLTTFAYAAPPTVGSCDVYPADNIWNAPVDQLPVDINSAAYINSINLNGHGNNHLHPDFGTEPTFGIPFITVTNAQAPIPINFTLYGDESDPGPYPTPLSAPIEGGSGSDGDRHVLNINTDTCILYELYFAFPQATQWDAGCGALYDLNVNGPLRTDGFTSADAAGLPIFPGLIRYEEVNAGVINHAIRFTSPVSQNTHIWPARHDAGDNNVKYPPMGARLRLKAGYDISGYPADVQVILTALKKYGMILADNGTGWFLTGAPNPSWNDDSLHEIQGVLGSEFEVVDTSLLMVDPNSGQARSWPPAAIFSDDFEDNDVTDWTPTGSAIWAASGGNMTASGTKPSDNFPNAFTAGCSNCIIEADLLASTTGARMSLLAWYQDSKNYVELRMMDDKNKVQLRRFSSSGKSKKSAKLTITPGVNYHVRLRYTNGLIVAEVGGLNPLIVNAKAVPSGTVGFRVQSRNKIPAGANFGAVLVY